MSNYMGFVYSMCVIPRSEHSRPLSEQEIILRAQAIEALDHAPVEAPRATLRESIGRLLRGAGRRQLQESRG